MSAPKKIVNTFEKGMSLDMARTFKPKGSYTKGRNVRLIQNGNNTNLAIENMLGNTSVITLPELSTKHVYSVLTVFSGTLNVTIDGISTAVAITATSVQGIRDQIYNAILANTFYLPYSLIVVKKYTDQIVIASRTLGSFAMSSNNANFHNVSTLQSQDSPDIIGYTELRDDLILFTTTYETADPSNSGQIWQVKFNPGSDLLTPSIGYPKLIYNGILGFSREHIITAIGRYESEGIQKVYWTDNYNSLRLINVADDSAFGIDEASLDVFLNINLTEPTITDVIGSGSLPVGVIQYAYKLIGPNLNETYYSASSILTHLTTSSESTAKSSDYRGSNEFTTGSNKTNSGKAVRLSIDYIDPRAIKLQIVAIHRADDTAPASIKIIKEVSCTNKTSYSFLHSTNESNEIIDITEEEFILNQYPFSTCKTIETKDNRLVVANLSKSIFDLEFDARAYRYTSVASGSTTYTTTTANKEEEDDINPYNADPTILYKYKQGTDTLGGTGPNISYKFKVLSVPAESNISGQDLYQNNPNSSAAIFIGDNYTRYNKSFSSYKSPYVSHLLRGYKRGEVYRFGIVLFDKKGSPGFAKWIADIRMPEISDVDSSTTYGITTPKTDFATCYYEATYGANMVNILYPEFDVTIPSSIASEISGYQIVRLERTEADKTCVAQGIVGKFLNLTGGSSGTDYAVPKHVNEDIADYYSSAGGTINEFAKKDLIEFNSPEVVFNKTLPKGSADYLQVVGTYNASKTTLSESEGFNGQHIYKYTESRPVTSPTSSAHKANVAETIIAKGSDTSIKLGPYVFKNYAYAGRSTGDKKGFHGTTLVCNLSSIFSNSANVQSTSDTFLVDYRRPGTNQYGGNTVESRAVNEYIAASAFQRVNQTTTHTNPNLAVFRGDTFICYFDYQRVFWNTNLGEDPGGSSSGTTADGDSLFNATYMPVETCINVDLRHDRPYSMGGVRAKSDGSLQRYLIQETDNLYGDLYLYNKSYSLDSNIQKYFPKPVDFKDTTKEDCTIYISNVKFPNETKDSWSVFGINNSLTVEPLYGEIKRLVVLRDKVFFFQNRGLGTLSINPRVAVVDSNGEKIQLGTGRVLDRFDYTSTEVGSSHQYGICKSDDWIYFIDSLKRKSYRVSSQGLQELSTAKGMQSFLYEALVGSIVDSDNTLTSAGGLICIYDHQFNEVLFTFAGSSNAIVSKTLVFNELTESYTSFADLSPSLYMKVRSATLSTDCFSSTSDIYQHNKGLYGRFYDVIYPSSLEFGVYDDMTKTKVFDAFSWITEVYAIRDNIPTSTWSSIAISNDYQATGSVDLVIGTNVKMKERQWNMICPRNNVKPTILGIPNYDLTQVTHTGTFKDRMRDKYLFIALTFDNTIVSYQANDVSLKLVAPYFETICRVSER